MIGVPSLSGDEAGCLTPNELAVQRAWALARAHGHLWAIQMTDASWAAIIENYQIDSIYEDDRPDARPPRTVEEAYAVSSHTYHHDSMGGIRYYARSHDGANVHSTGTGRIHWMVWPDGLVHVELRRTGATVAMLDVPARGASTVTRLVPRVPIYPEHALALEDCAKAVGAHNVLSRLWGWATPDRRGHE